MRDTTCIAYEKISLLHALKIRTYAGNADQSNSDIAMSHAFSNTDRNLFCFTYPDLVSKETYSHSCGWCKKLIQTTFCSEECTKLYVINTSIESIASKTM